MATDQLERTLDWRPRYDERSRAYAAAPGVTKLPTSGRLWEHGPVLDQGAEGACVGFGCAGEAAAQPVPLPDVTDEWALAFYRQAQQLDEWPGEAYSGTSVLAGCLAGRERGLWSGFRWAFSAAELAAAVVEQGPAVIGVQWRAGMYEAPGGVVKVEGQVVGGHCLLVLGFLPSVPELDDAPGFLWLNSWGEDYGVAGTAWISVTDLQALVDAGAELAIPEGRALPPVTAPADDDQQPATAPTRTLEVRADEVVVGDRLSVGKTWTTVDARRHLASGLLTLVELETHSRGVQSLRDGDLVRVRRVVPE